MATRLVIALFALFIIAAAVFFGWSWRGSISPIEPPFATAFDTAMITRGAQLSALGNCVACHTARGGKAYAGGRALPTPFGTIYGTNITPDPETGIGRWSLAAFTRAMREGVHRDGRHLYPAFPYDHYTLVVDEDIQALYAYVMTREPVRADPAANELSFPFNIRMLIAGWKLLYFEPRRYAPDAAAGPEWNRGAYLARGLGHCGACHTPRNFLGAARKRHYMSGGESEGWHAPAINPASRAPIPWTRDALFAYLRTGMTEAHSIATGPMAPVVENLGRAPEDDVKALATYFAHLMGETSAERQEHANRAIARAQDDATLVASAATPQPSAPIQADETLRQGASIYAGACASCHDVGRHSASSSDALHLALSTKVMLPQPTNLIRVILQGIAPPDGERGPVMPGFHMLTDDQVAALVAYLRADFSSRPEWRNLERDVRRVRGSLAQR
jgi:mono/diheme cytochrome c family protein